MKLSPWQANPIKKTNLLKEMQEHCTSKEVWDC